MRTDTDMENNNRVKFQLSGTALKKKKKKNQTRAQMRYCNALELEVTECARKPSTLTDRVHVAWKRKMDVQPNETKTP